MTPRPPLDPRLTEQRNPATAEIDRLSALEIARIINLEDQKVAPAVAAQIDAVARAIELAEAAFRKGGRLIYVGAGTSGRLGVLDASECPPTFRSDPEQVIGIIAGGDEAMFRAREGAEDSTGDGAGQIAARDVTEADVVCGIAAGGTTPFVHGALAEAKRRGAATLFVTCVEAFPNEPRYDVTIRALVGPEVLTGSTRLKAGTATKLILNQLTTTAFVRLGKCYDNWMVDLKATNAKLQDRAARIVAEVCRMPRDEAADVLREADGHVKVAIVMQSRGCDAAAARKTLAACGGRLREAIGG